MVSELVSICQTAPSICFNITILRSSPSGSLAISVSLIVATPLTWRIISAGSTGALLTIGVVVGAIVGKIVGVTIGVAVGWIVTTGVGVTVGFMSPKQLLLVLKAI